MQEVIIFQDEVRKVLKGTSLELLKEYFDSNKLLQNVDFDKEREKGLNKFVNFLLDKIKDLEPKSLSKEVNKEIHRIYSMKSGKYLMPALRELKNIKDYKINFDEVSKKPYDLTFNLFLKDKERFRNIYLSFGDGKNHKTWQSIRTDYVEKGKNLSNQMVEELFLHIKNHLLGEGMGSHYDINRSSFGGKEQIVIFYQGIPEEKPEIANKRIDMSISRSITKIVFLYDKNRAFVSVLNEDKNVRKEAHKIFAKVVFEKDSIPSSQSSNMVCKLDNAFKQIKEKGEIIFEIPYHMNVKKITAISASFLTPKSRVNITSLNKKYGYSNIRENISDCIRIDANSKNTILIENVKMTDITFNVEYNDYFSNTEFKTRKVTMSMRNSITNIDKEDVDFEILDCFREAGILQINKC